MAQCVSGCGSSEDPTADYLPEELIMKNVEMAIEGTILTIKVDMSKEFGPSASGKTTIIASTEGNVTIPGREEKVGLNVYRKK
jgi:hypothetical protein